MDEILLRQGFVGAEERFAPPLDVDDGLLRDRNAKLLEDAFGHAFYHTYMPPKDTGTHGRYGSRSNHRFRFTDSNAGQLSCPKVQQKLDLFQLLVIIRLNHGQVIVSY